MNSIQTLEKSIDWQNYVLKNSKDLKQKERAKQAIIKLNNELERVKNDLQNI